MPPSSRLMEQVQRQLAQGTIAAARQYFLQAAEAGSATGALRLGETYDAAMLVSLRTIGVESDAAAA